MVAIRMRKDSEPLFRIEIEYRTKLSDYLQTKPLDFSLAFGIVPNFAVTSDPHTRFRKKIFDKLPTRSFKLAKRGGKAHYLLCAAAIRL
jgi:hypothetical protein